MSSCKDTPEGKLVRKKYADILPLSRPCPSAAHPRMPVLNRAKIFSPFAALRGYEEEIADENRIKGLLPKRELSDEDQAALSGRLLGLRKGMRVRVQYFQADELYAPLGCCRTVCGSVIRLDTVYRELTLAEDRCDSSGRQAPLHIPFEDLMALDGEGLSEDGPYPDEFSGI